MSRCDLLGQSSVAARVKARCSGSGKSDSGSFGQEPNKGAIDEAD